MGPLAGWDGEELLVEGCEGVVELEVDEGVVGDVVLEVLEVVEVDEVPAGEVVLGGAC